MEAARIPPDWFLGVWGEPISLRLTPKGIAALRHNQRTDSHKDCADHISANIEIAD